MSTFAFRVNARAFEAAARAMTPKEFRETSGPKLTTAIKSAVNLVRREVRAELRPHKRTGRMASRVRTKVRGRGFNTIAGVKSTSPQSNMIAGGVRPHRITAGGDVMPIYGGRGRFVSSSGRIRAGGGGSGIEGFARSVAHPGFKGDPFFQRGREEAWPRVRAILADAGDEVAAAMARRIKR